MRKQYLRILIALIGVAGLGTAAKGQVIDQIVVNIPYEFVAAGKTLPAGTYTVNRVSSIAQEALILSSFENGAGAIVFSTQVENSSADKAQVTFEQVGGQHFLSKIETADHLFIIPISHSAIREAAAKSPSGTSASGSSGTN
jgi:hypothetical protein